MVSLAIYGCAVAGDYRLCRADFPNCPETPNCVSSRAHSGRHYIEPIGYEGTLDNARLRLLEVIAGFCTRHVVKQEDAYLHVEFTSLLFRFVDDGV